MRKHPVAQYSSEKLGLAIYKANVLTDADSTPTLIITNSSGASVSTPVVTRDSLGQYSAEATSPVSDALGTYTATWSFLIASVARTYAESLQVYPVMGFWLSLTDPERLIVESIYLKVANTYDSTEGGPYLWEVIQSSFNAWETIARLMSTDALAYISTVFSPLITPPYQVGLNATKPFPVKWYGLLEKAAYVEFLRHLSRSYIEQPDTPGVSVARLDRKRYRDEWMKEAEYERKTLDQMLKMIKRTFILGRSSMLVAGGIYPLSLIDPSRPSWLYMPVRF